VADEGDRAPAGPGTDSHEPRPEHADGHDHRHGDHDQAEPHGDAGEAESHGEHHDHGHDHGHDEDHGHDHGHGHEHQGGLRGFLTSLFRPHSHDAADSVDDALAGSEEGIRAVKLSLLGLGLTALLQLVVFLLSGSVALLADTIHNFADASTAIPLWLAFAVSRRAPNRRYTYGYGRAEDLAGVFVVLMITASAALAAYESVKKLLQPEPIDYLPFVAAAAVIGFLGNELVAQYRISTGERIGSAALVADGYHARTDGLTSLSVLLGAAGVWLGYPIADPLIGLFITVAILFVLKDAMVQIWHRLMDAVDPRLVERAEAAARAAEGVEEVAAVRLRWIGHSIHADAAVVADQELTLREGHEVAERARHAMLHAVPKLASVTIHVDPCGHDGHDPHASVAHHNRPARSAPAAVEHRHG
jgi:cation diffusion facilitator family transporter